MTSSDGQKIIQELVRVALKDGGYKSQSELARDLGIFPQKLNRWLNGHSAVSAEGVTLALELLDIADASYIKPKLERLHDFVKPSILTGKRYQHSINMDRLVREGSMDDILEHMQELQRAMKCLIEEKKREETKKDSAD